MYLLSTFALVAASSPAPFPSMLPQKRSLQSCCTPDGTYSGTKYTVTAEITTNGSNEFSFETSSWLFDDIDCPSDDYNQDMNGDCSKLVMAGDSCTVAELGEFGMKVKSINYDCDNDEIEIKYKVKFFGNYKMTLTKV